MSDTVVTAPNTAQHATTPLRENITLVPNGPAKRLTAKCLSHNKR